MRRRIAIFFACRRLRRALRGCQILSDSKYLLSDEEKMKFFQAIQDELHASTRKPVTFVGRIAGQYAKPRTQQFITIDGKQIHNYKGDIVNNVE